MLRALSFRVRRALGHLPLFALFASLCLAATAHAQRGRREPEVATKTTERFRAAFREVVAKASRSTVLIRCDDKETALGAVVGSGGWIITKASELKGKIVCQLHDGREFPAQIAGVSEPYDLAMLKVQAANLKAVEWRDSKDDAVGSWLATTGMERDPVAVGVLSVAARKISGPELGRRSSSGGFLGVRIAPIKNGVKVAQVVPKSAAAKAGFEDDDIILAVQGKPVADSDALFKALLKTRPGQTIRVRVKRDEEELELKPTLDKRPKSRSDFQNQLGSKLSDRRTGFPIILQHDAILRPNECGGPLVDLDGKVVGINIARAGRTETYAIPAETIKPLLEDLKSGK